MSFNIYEASVPVQSSGLTALWIGVFPSLVTRQF